MDFVVDRRQEDPTAAIQRADIRQLIGRGLSRKERLITILYYYEELTMKEIGYILDISESRVSQMHAAIIKRLRNLLRQRKGEFAA